MKAPPAIIEVIVNDELLGFRLEDGRFISVPIAFYPTLALATPEERGDFEINGSWVYWPELDADIGIEGVLAGAREHTIMHARLSSALFNRGGCLKPHWTQPRQMLVAMRSNE